MEQIPPRKGELFISKSVLLHEKWLTDQAIAAAEQMMKTYPELDGILRPSPVRLGDFSLVLVIHKLEPIIAAFIGIPGRLKPPIIEELFVG